MWDVTVMDLLGLEVLPIEEAHMTNLVYFATTSVYARHLDLQGGPLIRL